MENVIPSVDGKVRGVRVKVMSKGGRIQFLRRPIQHIYPLEVRSNDNDIDKQPLEVRSNDNDIEKQPFEVRSNESDVNNEVQEVDPHSTSSTVNSRPSRSRSSRKSAAHARDRIAGVVMDSESR